MIKSPPKAKQPRTTKPVTGPKPRPGAPIKRVPSSKKDTARSLERVLSNERMRRSISRGPADAIALLRSASIPLVPGLKREASEPLLSMIPKSEEGSLKERPVNLFSRSTSQIIEDPRAKKKALIESELQDAISAIKKPNRALVGKEITDAAEKRVLTSIPLKSKKTLALIPFPAHCINFLAQDSRSPVDLVRCRRCKSKLHRQTTGSGTLWERQLSSLDDSHHRPSLLRILIVCLPARLSCLLLAPQEG